ncbi:MAG: hypothetical protein ACI35R_07230 [Bacillus sp. (in: firmicutes)]
MADNFNCNIAIQAQTNSSTRPPLILLDGGNRVIEVFGIGGERLRSSRSL